MTQNARPEDGEAPLDPAAERVRRKLVRFMAINLGILFAAVMAVVLAIVYRSVSAEDTPPAPMAGELPAPPPGSTLAGEIALPAGARLVGHALSGSRLTLDIDTAGRRSILIYDIAEGRVIGRFDLVPGT
jgi:hypothetical protein